MADRETLRKVEAILVEESKKAKKAQTSPYYLSHMIVNIVEDDVKRRLQQHFAQVMDGDIATEDHSHHIQ